MIKFRLHYMKDGDDYIANVKLPSIVLQDISIERIKKKLPEIVKAACDHQINQMENGYELINDGDWKDINENYD